MSTVHRDLLDWYGAEKRDLPWRRTNDPYAIWISEVMLQQTQVQTVLPYFDRWMKRFPTAQSLARAEEQEVLSCWQGLGYYRRCRMLHKGAAFIVENGMPKTAKEWQAVPGIGPYTSAAISSIAFGEPVPLVDGNVERVFARLNAIELSGKALENAAWKWAHEVLDRQRPGDWNQALMELGATICKPAKPLCDRCPLSEHCAAYKNNLQDRLPTASPRPDIIMRREVVWIPYHRGMFGVRQIPEGQWWHGMWEFLRSDAEEDLRQIVYPIGLENAGAITYHVTRHRTRLRVFLCHVQRRSERLTWVDHEQLTSLPMPSPQRKALKLALATLKAPSLIPQTSESR